MSPPPRPFNPRILAEERESVSKAKRTMYHRVNKTRYNSNCAQCRLLQEEPGILGGSFRNGFRADQVTSTALARHRIF